MVVVQLKVVELVVVEVEVEVEVRKESAGRRVVAREEADGREGGARLLGRLRVQGGRAAPREAEVQA